MSDSCLVFLGVFYFQLRVQNNLCSIGHVYRNLIKRLQNKSNKVRSRNRDETGSRLPAVIPHMTNDELTSEAYAAAYIPFTGTFRNGPKLNHI